MLFTAAIGLACIIWMRYEYRLAIKDFQKRERIKEGERILEAIPEEII